MLYLSATDYLNFYFTLQINTIIVISVLHYKLDITIRTVMVIIQTHNVQINSREQLRAIE